MKIFVEKLSLFAWYSEITNKEITMWSMYIVQFCTLQFKFFTVIIYTIVHVQYIQKVALFSLISSVTNIWRVAVIPSIFRTGAGRFQASCPKVQGGAEGPRLRGEPARANDSPDSHPCANGRALNRTHAAGVRRGWCPSQQMHSFHYVTVLTLLDSSFLWCNSLTLLFEICSD